MTALLALDWGTTSARAYRMARDGRVLEHRSAALGVQHVAGGDFAGALRTLLGEWARLPVPRIACGMIGSRQGWTEAAYRACPVPLDILARDLARTPGRELAIVAGLTCRDDRGVPDVMRGEETQVAGLLEEGAGRVLVVHPGTHSKWIVAAPGPHAMAIERFVTFMTGETFAVLREHSILGRLMQPRQELDGASFDRGVAEGAAGACGGDLLHALFGARTLALLDELPPAGVADYLSGVLIGAEVAAGAQWAARHRVARDTVWLAGSAELCARYERALRTTPLQPRVAPPDIAARGLWRLALRAGLLEGDVPP